MSPKKKRTRRATPRRHLCRHAERLSIVSTRVLDGSEPVRLVAHDADGSWQFLDGKPVDVDHLVSCMRTTCSTSSQGTLRPFGTSPSAAWPSVPGSPWRIEVYVDE